MTEERMMTPKKASTAEDIARALGADRVVSLERLPSQGPLDLLELRAEVQRRLRSTGGRPTDPDWNVRRLVPFRREGWQELERLAKVCESEGQRVSPSQLAALLIERGIEGLKKSAGSFDLSSAKSGSAKSSASPNS